MRPGTTVCRHGHDLTLPDAVVSYGRAAPRCRVCRQRSNYAYFERQDGQAEPLSLAERCPAPFRVLRAQTRRLSPLGRLDAAVRFWRALQQEAR